jgi:hypothetical protein
MHQDLRPGAYVDRHSCAVVRMESEQNRSTLRHYLNPYVRIFGGQPAISGSTDDDKPVCTENVIRVDDVMESPKLAE